MNHYKWLEKHFPAFINSLGLEWDKHVNGGIFSAHGDKFYSYRGQFEDAGLHFYHGVAIGLLTYISPYSKESREVDPRWENGVYIKGKWIAPIDWIVANKDRFLPFLSTEDLIES